MGPVVPRHVPRRAAAQAGRWLITGLLAAAAGTAPAAVSFSTVFDDPGAQYSAYYADITAAVASAGSAWVSALGYDTSTTITVQVGFDAIPTANGRSATSHFVGTWNGQDLFEMSAATKLKTGLDVNGAAPDVEFRFGINGYLQDELWFGAGGVVPADKTDAYSVVLHEFGHAFSFNGWRDGSTGALPGNYLSTFDRWVTLDPAAPGGPTLYFTGPQAMAVYGGPVPLTFGNYAHVGNGDLAPGGVLPNGREGFQLLSAANPVLMNGVVYYRGTRYDIDPLALAITADAGLPALAPIPEPATAMLWLLGLAGLAGARHARRRG